MQLRELQKVVVAILCRIAMLENHLVHVTQVFGVIRRAVDRLEQQRGTFVARVYLQHASEVAFRTAHVAELL